MKIDDFLWFWKFNPEIEEGSEIKCNECGAWSPHVEWAETEVYCEDCGEHAAIECPKCGMSHDHVWSDTFETRKVGG
jgi:DNA-directed RNA polymerase subunit RPC12/RpoP